MIRAHIRLNTYTDVNSFIFSLDKDTYTLENGDGKYKVNAKSLIGVMYMSAEHATEMYVINETHDGYFPSAIDRYRI